MYSASAMSIVLAAVFVFLVGLFIVGAKRQRAGVACVAVAVCAAVCFLYAMRLSESDAPQSVAAVGRSGLPPSAVSRGSELPRANLHAGFVGSGKCQGCHQEHYSSWHSTYHRTMTQSATPKSVVPSFDGVTLASRGRTYHLARKGDEFWVDTVDPVAEMRAFIQAGGVSDPSKLPRAHRQIAMTTGSHLHQTYWMQSPNGTLIQFPWVYHISTGQWVYRIDSFLRPPSETVTFNIWNITCIACHSTGGEPRMEPATKSMHSVGEMGISCEACHGPGEQHVASANTVRQGDEPIGPTPTGETEISISPMVHPGKLDAVKSLQVCGQCHVIAKRNDERDYLQHGDPFRAGGDNFAAQRKVVLEMQDTLRKKEHFADSIMSGFWPDGTVRTGGREYNGVVLSGCHVDGTGERQMSCLSCHSMHDYASANKMMAKSKLGDTQCTQCHSEPAYTTSIAQHTHHGETSEGSRCINCHMPHTSYALFSAVRSHRIQSPSVRATGQGGRPNACNLCHLDQTQQWAASKLSDWYGIASPPLDVDDTTIASGALWALKGDAAQRAIAAWHMGWEPARDAARRDIWFTGVLAEVLKDKYSAVRYMAAVSLKSSLDHKDVTYDFSGTPEHHASVRGRVLEALKGSMAAPLSAEAAARLLLTPEGRRDQAAIDRLLKLQDQRPISIVE